MRWLAFFILAYVVLGLQLGVGQFVAVRGAPPNLVLVAVVFVAANAPRHAGLLGAFLLGLLQDLLTVQPLGLFAFAYGLVGLLVSGSRGLAQNDHPVTHVFLTFGAALVTVVVLYAHALIRPPGGAVVEGGEALPHLGVSLGQLLLSATYTALLAPLALWGLAKLKPAFGFRAARPRY